MRGLCFAVAVFIAGWGNYNWASAQDNIINRTAKGEAGKDIRIGVYTNIQPDCTSGPLPSIRLSTAPTHGKVTVKQGKINLTNYKRCLALQVSAYVAFYKSQPDFNGDDVFLLEVKSADGKTVIHRVTVTIAGSPSRPI